MAAHMLPWAWKVTCGCANELHLMEQECVWTFLMLFMLSFSAGPTPALNDIWMWATFYLDLAPYFVLPGVFFTSFRN